MASTPAAARRDSGITLTELRAFVAVVESRSFSQAARALGISQPSVSVQLAALEQACGVLLCHRKPGIKLTEAGQDLFTRARLVLSRVDEFESAAIDRQRAAAGRLSIGISTPHVAMPLLGAFMRAHADIKVTAGIGNTTTLLEDVGKCRIDLGIMTLVEPAPHFACALIVAPRLTVCMRTDDPLARRRALDPQDLAGRPFILREEGSQTRKLLEATFDAAAVPLTAALVLPTREAMKEAVAAGIGLGTLFDGENGADARLACIPFRSLPLPAGVYAVALKESLGIPAVRAFFDHIADL